jgi:hypothetical protein
MEPGEKWQANAEKVAYAKHFPGLLSDWADARGKTIVSVIPLSSAEGGSGGGRPGQVVLFDDRTFLVTGLLDPEPADLLNGLFAAGAQLEPWYPEAYARLCALRDTDEQLTRQARLEKILGAIRHNAKNLPELKEAVARLLKEI